MMRSGIALVLLGALALAQDNVCAKYRKQVGCEKYAKAKGCKWTGSACVVSAPEEPECSSFTDPCDCTGDCGWSSSTKKCVDGTMSQTSCDECSTMEGCIMTECEASGCPMEFDSKRVCQCTEDCAKYGNCCSDAEEFHKPDCSSITDPCACTGECGWSSSATPPACVASTESHTNCEECSSMDGCVVEECKDSSCPMDYDPMRMCQCNEDCDKYGNCCSDVDTCKKPEYECATNSKNGNACGETCCGKQDTFGLTCHWDGEACADGEGEPTFAECTVGDKIWKGKKVVKSKAADPVACFEECAEAGKKKCKGWSWIEGDKKPCRMYTKAKKSKKKKGVVSGKRNCHPFDGKQ